MVGINSLRALKNASEFALSTTFTIQSRVRRFAPVLLYLLFFLGPSLILSVHMSVDSYPDLLISGSSRIWLVMCFVLLSVYGTMRDIPVDGILVNFRDLGPMLAGLLGGPLIGGLAGLIGGIYRLSQGGWTAVPCAVATISAGLVAGFFVLLPVQFSSNA